jgi:hypothetical protein
MTEEMVLAGERAMRDTERLTYREAAPIIYSRMRELDPAIATEARRAGTVKQGPVHEGAGPKDIAQNQSAHKRLGDG